MGKLQASCQVGNFVHTDYQSSSYNYFVCLYICLHVYICIHLCNTFMLCVTCHREIIPVWSETWKFMLPEGKVLGRHEFSGLNKCSCLPTNWAINCLLYQKMKKLYFIYNADQRCKTWPWDMMSGGRHENLSHAHVSSLDKSYIFICYINYRRYIKLF